MPRWCISGGADYKIPATGEGRGLRISLRRFLSESIGVCCIPTTLHEPCCLGVQESPLQGNNWDVWPFAVLRHRMNQEYRFTAECEWDNAGLIASQFTDRNIPVPLRSAPSQQQGFLTKPISMHFDVEEIDSNRRKTCGYFKSKNCNISAEKLMKTIVISIWIEK